MWLHKSKSIESIHINFLNHTLSSWLNMNQTNHSYLISCWSIVSISFTNFSLFHQPSTINLLLRNITTIFITTCNNHLFLHINRPSHIILMELPCWEYEIWILAYIYSPEWYEEQTDPYDVVVQEETWSDYWYLEWRSVFIQYHYTYFWFFNWSLEFLCCILNSTYV